MSGHSKWSSIKHKKALKDARRGKLFTKLIKEITVAARLGGGDINANPRLRTAVLTARQNSMPTDNIDRAIKKGTGDLEGVTYDEVTYEGYGPGGVAILVHALTDNRNRTVADVRSLIQKYGGNLGASGSVGWMFQKCGLVTVERRNLDEDRVMEVALKAGADDVRESGDILDRHGARSVRRGQDRARDGVGAARVGRGHDDAAIDGRDLGQDGRADGAAPRGARGPRGRPVGVLEHGHRGGGARAAVGGVMRSGGVVAGARHRSR